MCTRTLMLRADRQAMALKSRKRDALRTSLVRSGDARVVGIHSRECIKLTTRVAAHAYKKPGYLHSLQASYFGSHLSQNLKAHPILEVYTFDLLPFLKSMLSELFASRTFFFQPNESGDRVSRDVFSFPVFHFFFFFVFVFPILLSRISKILHWP